MTAAPALTIFGIPGAGKTTLTNAIAQLFNQINRPFCIVNLDPASEYEADFAIRDVISVYDVQQRLQMGPNGSVDVCFQFALENVEILQSFIAEKSGCYFIFDMPGQVEAVVASESVSKLLSALRLNMAAVFLTDSTQLQTLQKCTSIFLQTAAVQAMLPFPFISVLTKKDLQAVDTDEFLFAEPQDYLQEFVQSIFVASLQICCFEIQDVKELVGEIDSRIGYFRGSLGEYRKLSKEDAEEIEAYMQGEQVA